MANPSPGNVVNVPPRYPTSLIFVDESGSKASSSKFFVIGALKVRESGLLARNIQDIRDRHGFGGEFKFSQITRGKLPVFCELINLLEQSDARLAACVVDRTKHDPFVGVHEAWKVQAKVTAQLLSGCINRRELVGVLLDLISTPRGCALDDTVRQMVNTRLKSTSVVMAACVDSRANDGLQVADLVAGAVAFDRRRGRSESGNANSHKAKVAARLAAAFGVGDFQDGRTDRVNIDTFRGQGRPRRPLRVVGKTTPRAG